MRKHTKIANDLSKALKKKPMTRFEIVKLFGDSANKTLQFHVKNGFVGKRKIKNTNPKVWANEVLEFYYIKDYFNPRVKEPSETFRNRETIYLNDLQSATLNELGGYKWLRKYLDEVDI